MKVSLQWPRRSVQLSCYQPLPIYWGNHSSNIHCWAVFYCHLLCLWENMYYLLKECIQWTTAVKSDLPRMQKVAGLLVEPDGIAAYKWQFSWKPNGAGLLTEPMEKPRVSSLSFHISLSWILKESYNIAEVALHWSFILHCNSNGSNHWVFFTLQIKAASS